MSKQESRPKTPDVPNNKRKLKPNAKARKEKGMLGALRELPTIWIDKITLKPEGKAKEDQEVSLLLHLSVPVEEWSSEKPWVEKAEDSSKKSPNGEDNSSTLTREHAEETEHASVEESNSGEDALLATEEKLEPNANSPRQTRTGNVSTKR